MDNPVSLRFAADALEQRLRIKIDTSPRLAYAHYTWTPSTRTLRVEDSQSLWMLLHEIGHYVIATTRERKRAEFGLGRDTDMLGKEARQFLTGEEQEAVEGKVSCLVGYWFYWLWRNLPDRHYDLALLYIAASQDWQGSAYHEAAAIRRLELIGGSTSEWRCYQTSGLMENMHALEHLYVDLYEWENEAAHGDLRERELNNLCYARSDFKETCERLGLDPSLFAPFRNTADVGGISSRGVR